MRLDPERDLEKAQKHFSWRSCVCVCERKIKKVGFGLSLRVQVKFSKKDTSFVTRPGGQRSGGQTRLKVPLLTSL